MFDIDPLAPNIVPSKYRQVSLSLMDEGQGPCDLDADTLIELFTGREAYMRTRFVVVRCGDDHALIEVARQPPGAEGEELFSDIEAVRVLAGPEDCAYVEDPDVDVGIPSQLARVAEKHPETRCVIVEGMYSHVSFLLNPQPFRLNVLDIVPPGPSKLLDQAQRLLDVGEDLPPIVLTSEEVDSRRLLRDDRGAAARDAAILLPCRVTGDDLDGAPVHFLDQRPPHDDWVLLGCQRSQQIHGWFYDEPATAIDTCPRRFLNAERDQAGPTLTRCCLLQEGMESRGRTVLVPWGSSLAEVGAAIHQSLDAEGFQWTPT